MRITRNLNVLVPLFLMFASIFGSPSGAQSAQTQSLVEGNTAFALDLYAQIKSSPGNLFFSPYSISTALAMTSAGARGDTGKQMAQVLHFYKDQRQVHASFGELQRQLDEAGKQKGVELSVANALWAQKDYPFLPAFLEIAKGNYQAAVNQADFKTGADSVRSEINRWVAQQTKDRIQNILPPGSLNDLTRLVLANAIYFKGAWAKPYNEAETSTQPFHLSTAHNAKVPLMHHFDNVRYMEEAGFQAVELPYRNGELSMVILLPRQVDGCGELENRLTAALVARVLTQMKQQKVEIFLPRFKLESNLDLSGTLTRMGMSDGWNQAPLHFRRLPQSLGRSERGRH